MLRLRQIEVLHAVLSCGSVTGAAELLNVSQPAVSKTLQQAQRQLGMPLFTRVAGRLQPTAEALALWTEIEQMVRQLGAIQTLADNLHRGQDAVLRVATMVSLSQTLVPVALAALSRQRPRMGMELRALHTSDLLSHLLLRETDVGIDFGGQAHPAVRRTVLVASEHILATPKAWLRPSAANIRTRWEEDEELAGQSSLVGRGTPFGRTARVGRRVSAGELAAHPIIGMDATDPAAPPLQAAGFFGDVNRLRLRAQTRPACLALVEQGVGVGIIDPFTAAAASADKVDLYRLSPPMPLALHALVPRARPHRALADALMAAVTEAACAQLALLGLPAKPPATSSVQKN